VVVKNQQGLMGSSGDFPVNNPPNLFQFFHQVDLGVQTTSGIEDQDIRFTGHSRFGRIKSNSARI
jgi:hypothetical protein